ncbi:MAG TPA: 3',5'-cyclic-nucleotide phosphodiesterase [Thermoanaerobaculia bacterium]|jgi:ribonuclease BN (tRNA processing enzyme)|nr:3',5'-cyclic-nucleotide phosphodiesterase [Thermoanaerobaculia bacterium]
MTCFLLDGDTALDAGSLTEALPLAAQRRLRRVVLTHAHLDHVASLPFLLENLYGRSTPLEVAAPASVLAVLKRDLFNARLWPDFTRLPSKARPTLRYRTVLPGRPFRAGGMSWTAVPVDHLVPAYGYLVTKPGRAVLFSGDTMPTERLWTAGRVARDLKAIFLEVSFCDAQAAVARASCHLTPRLLRGELAKAPERVPVFLYHMKPPSLSRIRREVDALDEPRLRLLESERAFRF